MAPYKQLVFNVLDFGADPNGTGTVDSGEKIQNAINAAQNAIATGNSVGAVVYIPAGNYLIFRPIVITSSQITIRGDGMQKTFIKPGFSGACWSMAPVANALNLTTGITTSGGNSFLFSSTFGDVGYGMFQLRDHQGAEMHGFTAWTIEFFYRPTTIPGAGCSLIGSGGTRTLGEAYRLTLGIRQESDGSIAATMLTTSASYTVNAGPGAVVAGTTYHVAMAWTGSQFRFYFAQVGTSSVVIGTQATAGTFTQLPYEDFTIGLRPQVWPEGGVLLSPPNGAMDSIRISNVALYTGTFTAPTAKFGDTASTTLLMNFDTNYSPFTSNRSPLGNGFLMYRRNSLVAMATGFQAMEGMTFNHSNNSVGPFIMTAVESRFDDIECIGGRQGFSMFDNCYLTQVTRYRASSRSGVGSRFGLLLSSVSGVCRLDWCHCVGGAYPLFSGPPGSGTFSHIFLEATTNTLWMMTLKNDVGGTDSYAINGLIINDEPGGGAVEFGLVASGVNSLALNGWTGFFFGGSGMLGIMYVIGGGSIVVTAPYLTSGSPVPELIKIGSPAPAKPVILHNLYNVAANPVTLTPGSVIETPGPILDTYALVKGSVDATKQLRFEVDGFTPATTRVATWPDADINVPGRDIANVWSAIQIFQSGFLRATSPQFTADISDSNGNEILKITAVSGAVNEMTIGNAQTGLNPTFTATGPDTNIGWSLVLKGTGNFALTGSHSIVSSSPNAFGVGRVGITNPGLNVDASAATCVTGFNIASLAAGNGVSFTVTSSGTNEAGKFNAKGTGALTFQTDRISMSSLGKVSAVAGNGATPSADSLTFGGLYHRDFSVVGNVGAGEDDLHSKTVAANVLGEDGDTIKFHVTGRWTAGASTRTVKVYYAGSILVTLSSASTDQIWSVDGTITRTDSGNARFKLTAHLSPAAGSSPTQFFAREQTNAVTHSSANIFKCTGESSGATNNDVTQTLTLLYKNSTP